VTLVQARSPFAAGVALLLCAASDARADRYEATIAIRPTGGYARVAETGADAPALVRSAGLAGGVSWGVRNWLDLGGELAASALGEATYDRAMTLVDDSPMAGPLRRMTRLSQLRGVATLRLGVAWVPTVQLALGAGVRHRSSALLRGESVRGETTYVPDGLEAGVTLDLVAGVRVGLEHRLTPRWTIGLSVGASHAFGVGAPDLQLADASFTLARAWYPGW
jgi:hypothetical protein